MLNNVELKEGTHVYTSDGKEVGKINRFVLNSRTNEVTHLVVEKGWLLSEDKVVPFENVRSATEDKVVLNEDVDDFDQLPPFEERHYVATDDQSEGSQNVYPDSVYKPGYYWYPPTGYLGYPAYGLAPYSWPPIQTQRNIPDDTVPLKEGAQVISFDDKHVGDVERLIVEPDSDRVTHFLISQGVFFKDHKLIPAHWISSVREDKVSLSVSSQLLERLPSYKP